MKQTFSVAIIGRGPRGAWAHMPVPFSVEKLFGTRARVAVKGTINGFAYRSSIMPRGDGTHYMALNKEMQAGANAGVGDTVKVTMEPDTAKRTVEVPPYLTKALKAAGQDKIFAALSHSHQKELVDWIADAKQEETRSRRIEKCVAMLKAKKTPRR
jgi:hypothetical protein